LEIYGNRYFKNHSNRNSRGIVALIILFHSTITKWSDMFVALSFLSIENKFVLTSCQTRCWKWLRKTVTRSWKWWKENPCNSMYHFVENPMRVHWNSRKRTKSSLGEFEEHHKWKVITWSPRSFPNFPSNFGISEGSLARIMGQLGSWHTKLFIILDKFGKFNVSRKESIGCAIKFRLPRLEAMGWLEPGK
jgi:hypothetical protein